MAIGCHADTFQRLGHSGMINSARTAQKPHMAIAPHHHHILDQHRKGPVNLLGLRNIGNGLGFHCGAHRLAQQFHLALRHGHKPHQGLEQGRFSGAVHTNQGGNRASGYGKTGVFQRGKTVAIGDGNALGPDAISHFCNPFTMVSAVTRSRSR